MQDLRSESSKFPRFKAIAVSLGRLAIAGTICGMGMFAIQYGDRVREKETKANLSGITLVSWMGMSFAFWGWEEYSRYQREREKRDRQQYFTGHLREREQEKLALQAQWDSDRQEWDSDRQEWDSDRQEWDSDRQEWDSDRQEWEKVIVSYQVQLSEQIQRRQEMAWELEQTRKVLPEIQDRSIIDDVLQNNQHLEAENAELLQNAEVFKGRIQQLQNALDNQRDLPSENGKDKIKRSMPLSQLKGFSSREVIHALQRLGFSCDRQRGSHVTLKKHVNCVIPIKAELAPGTLKSALQQANIDVDEFLDSLR